MFIKKKYEATSPFKITDVKCDRKWLSEVGDSGIIISCRINGVPCQFPFGAARWGMMVGGLGIDCDEVLFPATHSVWPERERVSTGGGGQNSYALFISDSVVASQPKENQKDFRFIGQLYSTAPIVKAFKPKLMELYNQGLLTQKFLERVGAVKAPSEEARTASLMIRGGKPTGLFEVVGRIAAKGNQAYARDLQGIYSQYMGLRNVLFNTDGLGYEQVPGKPYYVYSVSPELHRSYVSACKDLGRPFYYDLKGMKRDTKTDAPYSDAPKPADTYIPFDDCFLATLILDAEDHSGGRECSWIDRRNLAKALATYKDEEGTLLSRKISDLSQIYDKMVERAKETGKPVCQRVGGDYDTVDKNIVPGLKSLYTTWPPNGRGARAQKETSLWMVVAPSRDSVEFDSNEWNHFPVKSKK